MQPTIWNVLVLICLLQIKHMFADYFLQTKRMLSGRGEYFHMGRAQHAGVHSVLSLLVLLVIGAPIPFVLALVLAEWVVHFHIDWGKGRYTEIQNYDHLHAGYWRAYGFDQTLHQLTYVVMAWAWVKYAAV